MLNTLVVVQELTKFNVEIQRDIITQVQGGSMSECHLTSTLKIKRFVFFFWYGHNDRVFLDFLENDMGLKITE